VTGRARAVESYYLNQLERMHFLERRRQGRTVYFSVTNFNKNISILISENGLWRLEGIS